MARPEKLLERMRRSPSGWGPDDLATLYTGFGFQRREGSNHTVYSHPQYPDLRATVARHSSLATGYVKFAVQVITELKAREAPAAPEETESGGDGDPSASDP